MRPLGNIPVCRIEGRNRKLVEKDEAGVCFPVASGRLRQRRLIMPYSIRKA
jgi:hypothetical protein